MLQLDTAVTPNIIIFLSLRRKILPAPSLLRWSDPCYKASSLLTCSIVWIMLPGRFNRLVGVPFSILAECAAWGMMLRAEETSWKKITQNAASRLGSQREQGINCNMLQHGTTQSCLHIYTSGYTSISHFLVRPHLHIGWFRSWKLHLVALKIELHLAISSVTQWNIWKQSSLLCTALTYPSRANIICRQITSCV